jgi:fibronectin-binding autotransporter adhesin
MAGLAAVVLMLAGPALALTTYTWTNSSGGSLGTADNWNTVPTFDGNAELLFSATNAPFSGSVVTLDGDRTIGKLNVDITSSNNYTLYVAPGTPASSRLSLQDLNVRFIKGNQNGLTFVVNISNDLYLTGSGNWTNTLTTPGGTGPSVSTIVNGAVTSEPNTTLRLNVSGAAPYTFNGRINAPDLLLAQSVSSVSTFNAPSNAIRGISWTGGSPLYTFTAGGNTIGTNGLGIAALNSVAAFSGGGNTFNGLITVNQGTARITFDGPSNAVNANVNLQLGTIRVGAQNALGGASVIVTNRGGILETAGNHAMHMTIVTTNTPTLTFRAASGVVTYDGTLVNFVTNVLVVNGSDGVLRFNPSSGVANNVISNFAGALAVAPSGITLPGGNLGIKGGTLLVESMSMADWLAQRAYGTGNNQWQFLGGGFAARGTNTLVVSGLPAGTLDNRLTRLGTIARDENGAYYAEAPVNIAMDMVMTGVQTVAVSETGPGLTGASSGSVIHTISGNISGSGAPQFTYQTGVSEAALPEVILAGTNNVWTGNIYSPNGGGGSRFNTGRGGLLANQALVRFAGPESLPNGAVPGTLTYLATWNTDGGYILGGSSTGTTYNLGNTRSGYRFLTTGASMQPVLGVDGGIATLENTILQMNHQKEGDGAAGGPMFLARRGCTLNLGSPEAPLYCVRSWGVVGTPDGGLAGAATVLTQSSSIKILYKRGEGTVVVRNMAYKLVDGVTDDSVNTAWQIGRGQTGNAGTNAYFDGALREGTPGAAVNRVILAGGVLETSGTYTRVLGNNPGQLDWGYGVGGGGGFAAYGGNLDVTISTFSTGNTTTTPVIWGSTQRFILSADAMIFGSYSTDARTDFKTTLRLDTTANTTVGTREVRIIDNTGSTNDVTRFSGSILGTAFTTLNKAGDGVLELTATNNQYAGPTLVSAGTLLVNGWLVSGGDTVSVASGATLGGTGTINRAVTVYAGAGLAPGAYLGQGTLTLASNVTIQAGAVYNWTYGGGVADLVSVGATLTLPTNVTVVVSGTGGLPSNPVLFSANALAGATDLSGWTVVGAPGAIMKIQGVNVLLSRSSGTVFQFR